MFWWHCILQSNSRCFYLYLAIKNCSSFYLLAGGRLTHWEEPFWKNNKKKCFLCGTATIVISCPMEKLGFCVCCSNISLEAQSHRIQQSWNSHLHTELLLFTGTCLLLCLSGSSLVHTLISYLLKGCIFLHGLHKYWKSFLTVCVEQPNLYQW